MPSLERAIEIAVSAHAGQTDKGVTPYVPHPFRVMISLDNIEERTVGGHNVVEYSNRTFDNEKSAGFTDEFIDALRSVNKNETEHGTYEGYSQFIEQAQISHIGSRVKMADLKANLDVSRLREITEQDSTGLTG